MLLKHYYSSYNIPSVKISWRNLCVLPLLNTVTFHLNNSFIFICELCEPCKLENLQLTLGCVMADRKAGHPSSQHPFLPNCLPCEHQALVSTALEGLLHQLPQLCKDKPYNNSFINKSVLIYTPPHAHTCARMHTHTHTHISSSALTEPDCLVQQHLSTFPMDAT